MDLFVRVLDTKTYIGHVENVEKYSLFDDANGYISLWDANSEQIACFYCVASVKVNEEE